MVEDFLQKEFGQWRLCGIRGFRLECQAIAKICDRSFARVFWHGHPKIKLGGVGLCVLESINKSSS